MILESQQTKEKNFVLCVQEDISEAIISFFCVYNCLCVSPPHMFLLFAKFKFDDLEAVQTSFILISFIMSEVAYFVKKIFFCKYLDCTAHNSENQDKSYKLSEIPSRIKIKQQKHTFTL